MKRKKKTNAIEFLHFFQRFSSGQDECAIELRRHSCRLKLFPRLFQRLIEFIGVVFLTEITQFHHALRFFDHLF